MVTSTKQTASDLLAVLASGQLSARDAVAAQLSVLRELDNRTNAVAAFDDERAMSDAWRLDQAFVVSGAVGPLHGLPITVKDWLDVEGFPCAGGSAADRERRPTADATVVARLRRAGAVVLAKTNVWRSLDGEEIRHPADPERSPGGSSSGEAVAVADGASPLGIGSDSGGSIRLPAAWCGVFGLKPTAGRVPTTGHFPQVGALSDGRTQIGPIARSVPDLELALTVTAGPDWRDAGVAPVPLRNMRQASLRKARFAVVTGEEGWQPTAELADAAERAAAALSAAGLARVPWTAPWLADGIDITRRYWARAKLTGKEAEHQLEDWDRFRSAYLQAAEHIDFLVTPASLEPAPLQREITGDDFIFEVPVSLTGSPAIVVPAGSHSSGLPLAVQVVGRPWEDHRVLGAAHPIAEQLR